MHTSSRTLLLIAAFLGLAIPAGVRAQTVVWNGGGGANANWSDAANWNGATVSAGESLAFAGSTSLAPNNDLTAGTSFVNITFNANAGAFTVGGNSLTLTGGASNLSTIINSSGSLQTLGMDITMTSVAAYINAGTAGLAITGRLNSSSELVVNNTAPGVLTLTGGAAVTGTTALVVDQGILALNSGTYSFGTGTSSTSNTVLSTGSNAGALTIGTAGTGATATFSSLAVVGNSTVGATVTQSNASTSATMSAGLYVGNTAGNAKATYTMNGGVLTVGNSTTNGILDVGKGGSSGEFDLNGGTVYAAGTSTSISSSTAFLEGAGTGNGSGVMKVNGGAIYYYNAGGLQLNNNAGTGTAALYLNGGTLGLTKLSSNAAGGTGSTAVYFNGGTLQALAANTFIPTGDGSGGSATQYVVQAGGAVFDANGNALSMAGALVHDSALGAALDGGLTLNPAGDGGSLTLSAADTFTGDTVIDGGILILGNSLALQDSTLNYNNQGGTVSFGSLTSVTLGGLKGSQSLPALGANVALSIGNNNQSTTYSGVISGSTASVTKVGTGTLTLTGANTYGGNTAVNVGKLVVNGSIASAMTTVNSGGTLAGTGTTGAITLNADGFLAPGNGAVGTLRTNNKALTWNGGASGDLTGQLQFVLSSSGSTASLLNLGSGAFTKGTGSVFAFDFLGSMGVVGDAYTLVSYGSTSFSLGDFMASDLGGGETGTFSFSGNSLVFTVNAIPEPSMLLLLAGGILCAGLARSLRTPLTTRG